MTPREKARVANEAEVKKQKKIAFKQTLYVITHWERPHQLVADVYYISREVLRRYPEIMAKWNEHTLAEYIEPKLVALKHASFEVFNEEWIESITPVKLAGGGGVVYLHGKPPEDLEFRKRHGITLVTEDFFDEKNVQVRRETTDEEVITYKLPRSVDDAFDYTPGRGRGSKPFGVCFSYLFGKGQPNYFDQAADFTTSAKGGAMAERAANRAIYNNENEHASDTETDDIIRHAEAWSDMVAENHREEIEEMRKEREEEKRRKFKEQNPDAEENDV